MNIQRFTSKVIPTALIIEPDENDTLRDSQKSLITNTANWIKEHGLETPALFFLEMNRPLQGILRVGLIFSQPLLGAIVGFQRLEAWSELLSSPLAVDYLARELERPSPGAH